MEPPGCHGVTFLPFLNGERTPNWPQASGSVLGERSLVQRMLRLVSCVHMQAACTGRCELRRRLFSVNWAHMWAPQAAHLRRFAPCPSRPAPRADAPRPALPGCHGRSDVHAAGGHAADAELWAGRHVRGDAGSCLWSCCKCCGWPLGIGRGWLCPAFVSGAHGAHAPACSCPAHSASPPPSCLPAASELRVVGGGSQNKLWRRIVADAFQLPLRFPAEAEAAALGAALQVGRADACMQLQC